MITVVLHISEHLIEIMVKNSKLTGKIYTIIGFLSTNAVVFYEIHSKIDAVP